MQKIISIIITTITLYFSTIELSYCRISSMDSCSEKYSVVILEYNPLKMYIVKHLQDNISSTYITQLREIIYTWAILSCIKSYIK